MKRRFFLIPFAVIIPFLAICWFVWRAKRDAEILRRLDTQIVAETEQAVEAHLAALEPNDPIYQRYGEFISLEGTGYYRFEGFKLGPSLTLDRRAIFRKGEVRCPIRIGYRGPLKLTLRMTPGAEWLEKNPHVSLVKAGSEFKLVGKNMEGSTALSIAVAHPRFASDAGDWRSQRRQIAIGNELFDDFVAGIVDNDRPRLADARQALDAFRTSQPIDRFLGQAFQHPDPRVGIEAAKWLAGSQAQRRLYLADSTRAILLDVVGNPDESVPLRRQVVEVLMRESEPDREALYTQLEELGADGHFAIPALAAFVEDNSRQDKRSGGAAGAPIGVVELLGSWGPASAEAVPALITALEEHPNTWDFRPAAAAALGQIGPAASQAIAPLQQAAAEERHEIQSAALVALEQIRPQSPEERLRQVKRASSDAPAAPFYVDRRSQISWLGSDGQTLELICGEGAQAGFYQVDLASCRAEQRIALETETVVAARAVGDRLRLLRLIPDPEGSQVVLETWSVAERQRKARRVLARLPALKPKNESQRISQVVWHPELAMVAFVVQVRSPVPVKPGAFSVSNEAYIYGLDPPHDLAITEVTQYLMTPIGFSADSQRLYFHGRYFEESWTHCLAAMDLASGEFTPLLETKEENIESVRITGDGRFAVGEASTAGRFPIKVISLATMEVHDIRPDMKPDYFTSPWRFAVALSSDGQTLAVATKATLDLYAIDTGKRIDREMLPSAEARRHEKPLLLEIASDQLVYAGLSVSLPYETQTLWVKRMPIE